MLSYQHGYHAGNFADVHKHTALCSIIDHFKDHKKVVTFLDSHSGRALYDLSDEQAQKTGEWKDGIGKIHNQAVKNDLLKRYLATLEAFQENHTPQTYPGSPALVKQLMQPNQRAVCFELHPAEFEVLQSHLSEDQRFRLVNKDAQQFLIDFLPARQSDGALLIDPSYEIKDDYSTIARLTNNVHKRWKAGVIMVWYPMLPEGRHETLKADLKDAVFYELIGPERARGMYGTGLAVLNAPDGFHESFTAATEEMKELLFP